MKGFLFFTSICCLLVAAEAEETIYIASTATEDLVAKEGQIIVVHGNTERSAKIASGTNFVNFADSEFVLVTFKSDLDQFPDGEPHELYDGKRVAVEGPISIYKDKPQIKLVSPDQVTVLEPDAEFPPKEPEMKQPEPVAEATTTKKKPEERTEPEPKKRKPPVDAAEFFK